MSAPRKAVLAVDHGEKKTGFAATDALRIATRPLEVWRGPGESDELVERVVELVEELDAGTVLIGMPVHMDGRRGARAEAVTRFMARLVARLPAVELIERDERLTTKAAEELMREAGHDLRAIRERRDSWSALVILRDWLEEGEPGAGG